MKRQKILLKIFNFKKLKLNNIKFYLKAVLFRNKDIISGEELVECGIVSEETKNKFLNLKNLRKLNNIYYIWDYNKDFKRLIFSYKYNRKIILSKLISELIEKELKFIVEKEKIDYIVTVPINRKRKNERGFNQVNEILNHLDVKYVELKRIKNTKKMHTLLDENLRKENIKGSFFINKSFLKSQKIDFKNKNILLFDDIITTGSTLREIKNSILNSLVENREKDINEKIYKTIEENTKFIIFCLAAAKEIKMHKGEI